MADQRSKGPSKPKGVSEHDWQEQLRAGRKQSKSAPTPDPVVKLILVLTPRANRSHAYDSLQSSEVLSQHGRRYKYHEPRQLATMAGKFHVEVPQSLVNQLKGELTPGWKIEDAEQVRP